MLQGATATLHQARTRRTRRRRRREPLTSVSLEGMQTQGIAQASQHNNRKKYAGRLDAIEMCGDFADPLLRFFTLRALFGKTQKRGKGESPRPGFG